MTSDIKRSVYNVAFGFVGQVIVLGLGLVIPRLFLVNLGSAANGLLTSAGQILAYLSLLEAGLGAASIQALYKPISLSDTRSINSILSATKSYYEKTGKLYLLSVIVFSLVYPLSTDEFPFSVCAPVIFFTGIPGAINYIYQGKFRVLLQAEGKSYLIANVTTVVGVMSSLVKIWLISSGCGLVTLQASYCIVALLPVLYYHVLFKRRYQWVNFNVEPDFSSLNQKNAAFIQQISSLVLTNSPVIILTFFTNLKVVSVFVIYSMIYDTLTIATQTVSNGVTHVVGKSYYKGRESFSECFSLYEMLFFSFSFSVFIVAYLFTVPFLSLYTKGVTDISYIMPGISLSFLIFKLVAVLRTPALNTANATGHFKQLQTSSILEATLTIVLSCFLVSSYGICGVLIGTTLALLLRALFAVYYVNHELVGRSSSYTIIPWTCNALLGALICYLLNGALILSCDSYVLLFFKALAALLIIGGLFLIFNVIIDSTMSKSTIKALRVLLSHKSIKPKNQKYSS